MALTQAPQKTIDRAGIEATEELIRPHIRRTPVVEVRGTDFGLNDCTLIFKLELCQHAGSFKTRGAFANLLGCPVPASGVVAASGGNHGAAVAYAAHKLGVPATIFVPAVASPAKVDKIRSFGANLVVAGDRYVDALAASKEWAQKSGALPIHAFDQTETVLGQGTLALEFEQQAAQLDTVLAPVGGGGLIGGVVTWFAQQIERRTIKIVGVEPEAAPTLAWAIRAGHPVDAPAGGIAADSLASGRMGEITFPIAQKYVNDVLLVSDESIQEAQESLWSNLRIVAEPGGAAALAALLSRLYSPKPRERLGIIVSGGNTAAVNFSGRPATSGGR